MRYLLDTNICIALIRQKSPSILHRLTQLPLTEVAVSALTVAELHYGVETSAHPAQNRRALEYFLLPLTILPFDAQAAVAYGQIRATLEGQGMPIGAIDLLLAAQAIRRQMIMVTNNVREFVRVPGLSVEDWSSQ